MAVYNLERLSIFLVEDNRYVRNILENMLGRLRFGRVMTASDGAETIDFLKTMHSDPLMSGGPGLDIVISDLLMSPVNRQPRCYRRCAPPSGRCFPYCTP